MGLFTPSALPIAWAVLRIGQEVILRQAICSLMLRDPNLHVLTDAAVTKLSIIQMAQQQASPSSTPTPHTPS